MENKCEVCKEREGYWSEDNKRFECESCHYSEDNLIWKGEVKKVRRGGK